MNNNHCIHCVFLGSKENFDMFFCSKFSGFYVKSHSFSGYNNVNSFIKCFEFFKIVRFSRNFNEFFEAAKLAVNKGLADKCELDSSRIGDELK